MQLVYRVGSVMKQFSYQDPMITVVLKCVETNQWVYRFCDPWMHCSTPCTVTEWPAGGMNKFNCKLDFALMLSV
jgi:hypothetical protein